MNDLYGKLKNIIKKALITLDRSDPKGQSSCHETTLSYEAIKPYGFHSIAKKGSTIIMFNVNADPAHRVGFEYDNKKLLDEVEAGEVAVYHPDMLSYVIFKNNGDIKAVDYHGNQTEYTENGIKHTEVNGAELNLSGDKVALGGTTAELLQQISDQLGELKTLFNAVASHTHPPSSVVATALAVNPLAIPTDTGAASTSGDWTAAASAMDTIKGLVDGIKGTL